MTVRVASTAQMQFLIAAGELHALGKNSPKSLVRYLDFGPLQPELNQGLSFDGGF